jgi:hydroxymethylbilane synthase
MPEPPVRAVVVGTRRSPLARAQTRRVIELLEAVWPGIECREREVMTEGDRTQAEGRPLPEIGGKGLFTQELEAELREERIQLAVHSLKDLPTDEPSGIVVGAVCQREDPRDCLVSHSGEPLSELPAGAVLGTSSLRRAAQLRALRPELEPRSIRGNVDTRLRKVRDAEYDGVLLAAAGVRRLGRDAEVSEWLPVETMVPAPGQGALAVQCRDEEALIELLRPIDDAAARVTTTAERAFLQSLGGGCAAPVAAHAVRSDVGVLLRGLVLSPDGSRVVRVEGAGEPTEVGERLAEEALGAGADAILEASRA